MLGLKCFISTMVYIGFSKPANTNEFKSQIGCKHKHIIITVFLLLSRVRSVFYCVMRNPAAVIPPILSLCHICNKLCQQPVKIVLHI